MQANLMLLLAAAIWGLGFVAQRLGMDHLGPYSFNGLRFFIGAFSLLPLIWWYQHQGKLQNVDWKLLFWAGLPVGVLLFIAASLQQVLHLYHRLLHQRPALGGGVDGFQDVVERLAAGPDRYAS